MKRKSFLTIFALLVALVIAAPASGGSNPIPRVHAADSNRDAGREVHSTTLTRVAVRSTITWSGASGDARWSNPANWEGGVVPGPFDIARFAASARDAIVDAAFGDSVAGIVLENDFAGTLHLARGLIVRGDVVIANGMLVTPADQALSVNTLDIRSPGIVRMGANGKLNISGDGTPLTGNGTLDVQTNKPNSVEYTGHATSDLTAAPALATYRTLGLDQLGKDPRTGASSPPRRPLSFSESVSLTLHTGEDSILSAVIDTSNGYAYFGTHTSPGIVVKVRLSDFTRVGALTLITGEKWLTSAVIDTTNGFAYFGTMTTPGIVVKVHLSDLTRVGALTLNAGEIWLSSAVIDTSHGFAYFGTNKYPSPGIVVKVHLSDLTRVGALTLNTGENSLGSAVIDTPNGFAYFGTYTFPGRVVKVHLSDLTRVAALTLNTGEDILGSAVIDTPNGFAYFGTIASSPGIVVKVHLSDLTRVGALTLNTGENMLESAVIDTPNGFAYFGTNTYPGRVVKVHLSDLTRVAALTLNEGEDSLVSAVIDTPNGFAYFGTGTSPGIVVKVNLGAAGGSKVFLPAILR
jgi:hypothetical protein